MVGVNAVKAFGQYRFGSKAGIFKGALAHEFWGSVRPGNPHPGGKTFQNRLPNIVPGTRLLLSALLLIDVPEQAEVANNVVGTVPLAVQKGCEPLIFTGRRSVSCLELLGLAGGCRPAHCAVARANIFWM